MQIALNLYYNKLKSIKLIKFYFFYKERIYYPFFLWKYRLIAKILKKTIVHFIHIGKTGGTAVKSALNNEKKPFINHKYIIISHPHFIGLEHVLKNEKAFFFVRNPVDRFVSGFYSRKRKGMPHIYNEWSKEEAKTFEKFNNPNQLALSLTSNNMSLQKQAIKGMKSIGHIKTSYWDWFKSPRLIDEKIDNIIFVGSQRNLNSNFEELREILEISEEYQLPQNETKRHKNPESFDKKLDMKSVKNIMSWYAKDFDFLNYMNKKLLEKGANPADFKSDLL